MQDIEAMVHRPSLAVRIFKAFEENFKLMMQKIRTQVLVIESRT